jgi:hypothetical protein
VGGATAAGPRSDSLSRSTLLSLHLAFRCSFLHMIIAVAVAAHRSHAFCHAMHFDERDTPRQRARLEADRHRGPLAPAS